MPSGIYWSLAMTRHTVLTAALALTFAGCTQPTAPTGDALTPVYEGTERVADGTPEALGMLDFLNDPSTTFELLDDQLGLDRRAAESLIAHRNGPDGTLGYEHDDLFDSVGEVDDCYYVGQVALDRIQSWARDHDWIAQSPDDLLGTWDGVEFTVAEADATVELANTAGRTYLDDDLGLDVRAVTSIIDARPIATVDQLAGLYYVGTSALTTLRDTAAGTPQCDVDGWETEYVYADDAGQWRSELPAEVVAIIDQALTDDAWCGEATGHPWFVMATVDRFNCDPKGYTIELGQWTLENPGASWYIEFEVTKDFGRRHSDCEI